MKNFINYIIEGMGIAFVITTGFMYFYARYGTGQEIFSVYTTWLIFGAAAGIATNIFNLKIKIMIKIIIHILVLSSAWYLSMLYTFNIFNLDYNIPIFAILLFIIIYLSISLCFGYVEKKKIEQLNKKFQN